MMIILLVLGSFSALALPSTTDADLLRARTMVPRPTFKGPGFHGMSETLNGHLKNMKELTTKPCSEFSIDELHDLLRLFFPLADENLLAIYQENDQVMLKTKGRAREFELLADLDKHLSEMKTNLALEHDKEVYRDGLCHKTVMWYVHHLPTHAKQTVNSKSIELPLLPTTSHSAKPTISTSVMHAYSSAATCGACHVGPVNTPDEQNHNNNANAPPLPVWGGARSYNVTVNITSHDVVTSGASWLFRYYYSSSTQGNYSRYEHQQGQQDEICHGVAAKDTSPCTMIFSNINLYVFTNNNKDCCACKMQGGYGAIRTDWLNGGSYVGQTTVRGIVTDEWFKQGASDNHYYAVSGAAPNRPVRFMEHKDGLLKQWDFDTEHWNPGPQPQSLFVPPTPCLSQHCVAGFCTQ